MSCRSDVAITINKKDYEQLLVEIQKQPTDLKDKIIKLLNGSKIRYSKSFDFITIFLSDIKWQCRYKDIEFIENYISGLDEYLLNRIGEDVEDNETIMQGNNISMFSVNEIERTINFGDVDIEIIKPAFK